jgi:hybrid cluster-associated redox disulfide protein
MGEERDYTITKNTNICDALEKNPRTAKILFEAGIGCFGCIFANAETLEQGLLAHGFSEQEINEIIQEINKTNKKQNGI